MNATRRSFLQGMLIASGLLLISTRAVLKEMIRPEIEIDWLILCDPDPAKEKILCSQYWVKDDSVPLEFVKAEIDLQKAEMIEERRFQACQTPTEVAL